MVTASRVFANLLNLGSMVVLARILTPDDFGLVALATTTLAILSTLTNTSLTAALVHHAAPTREHMDTAFSLNSLRGLAVALVACIVAVPMSQGSQEPRLLLLMVVLSPTLIIEGIANPRLAILLKDLHYWPQVALQVSLRLASVSVSIAIALIYKSYWALALGALAGQAVSTAVSYAIAPYWPRFSFSRFKELWSFSIWLTLSQVMTTLTWKFDSLLIGSSLGRTQLGYYSVGENLAGMPTKEATMPLYATLLPALTRLRDSQAQLAAGYQRAQTLLTAVALPLGVGTTMIAEPLVRLMLGPAWGAAVPIVQVLATVLAFQTMGSLVHTLGMASGVTPMLFRRDTIIFLTRVPIILGGMLLWGLPGVLMGRILGGVIDMWANMAIARHVTGLTYAAQLRANVRSFVSVAVMAGAVYLTPALGAPVITIALQVAVGGAAYVGTRGLLWLLARKPEGPETEIFSIAARLTQRLRRA